MLLCNSIEGEQSDSEDAKSSSIAFAENEKWATNEREEESTGLTSMELSELSQPAATGKPLWWMSSEDESSSALVTQTGAGTNATEELTKTQSSWLKSEPAPLMNEGEPVEIPEKVSTMIQRALSRRVSH